MKPEAEKTLYLTCFIVLKFALQYILISPEYELHRDEFLYLDQANHLAWGYLSVPPFISWTSLVIKLLGNSVFWVKFFPSLWGVLTLVLVWKSIEALNGSIFSLVLGATCLLFSSLLRLNTLYQPNSFDILCWTTFYYVVIQYLNTRKNSWLFIGALVLGLGFLNKYNIVFLVIGLLPAVLVTRQRQVFGQRPFYWAALLGLLIISGNLIWQWQHHFPVIQHMQELADIQLIHIDRLDFLKSQVLLFLGSMLVIISGLYALIAYRPFRLYRLFFWTLVFTLTVFLYFRAKDYYAMGLYPVYIAFGSVFLGDTLKNGRLKYLRPVAISIPIIVFIPMYLFVFPNKSPNYIEDHEEKYQTLGLLRWEDGRDHKLPQDFADMLGWEELAMKVDAAYAHIDDPDHTLILCDNYGQAGAINFYTKMGIRAVSFNADYINWFDLDQQHTNLIRVKNHWERANELSETGPFFETALLADSVTNRFAREYGTTIFVFTGANIDVNQRIRNEVREVRGY